MHPYTRLPGTPVPMHHWTVDVGLQLAGDSWGDPHGPLVLLLHGVGQTRHAWRATGRILGAAGYHAVAFDARGHGDSDWAADGDYSRDAMIRDLERLIAKLEKRPALVGASMGGATSLIGVGEGHIDASALILVDIAPRTEPSGVAKVKSFMRDTTNGFRTLEEAADAIHAYRPRAQQSRMPNGIAKNLRMGADGRYHWHWDPQLMARGRESDERRVEAARRLTLPTLLVRGGQSDVVSEEGARDFLGLCPKAEFVNIAGAGHMVSGDRNDVFGRAALGFLRRAVPAVREALRQE
ncbi:alpha/beta hydrolase [Cupriavidus lacunae]|uniref:Alpha/beta hydrolase n=2 Tax=Cupriavidus lacunae TaxID=2666307 RepID=A0A370NLS2_9BURK|nr:alpha/beta hydrolase [Cupriavidus lacunae]